MDTLKEQMKMDMGLRGLSKCTCKTYLKQMYLDDMEQSIAKSISCLSEC